MKPRRDRIGPIWVYLVALAVFFTRFGYGFATGDQDEILPFLLHLIDPSLFQADWFVQLQAGAFSVRTYFVWLLLPFARVLPLWLAIVLLYITFWLATANAAFKLSLSFTRSYVGASFVVVVGLGLLHKWTLGSNDLIYSMLVPEMAAWPLILYGVRDWIEARHRRAAVLIGIAAWFQVLIALLVFSVLVAEYVWAELSHRHGQRWTHLLLTCVAFVVASLPVSIPIIAEQMVALPLSDTSVFYVLAPFRNPFHHMFFAFELKTILRFSSLLVMGGLALWLLRNDESIQYVGFLGRVATLIIAACFIMIVFTEIVPFLPIAKLQLFKLTVLLKLLILIPISVVAERIIAQRGVTLLQPLLLPTTTRAWIAPCIGLTMLLVSLGPSDFVNARLASSTRSVTPLGAMEDWIAVNTPLDAVVATPPSNSSFRSNARRAIVVNYAAFPYNDIDMVAWYDRLMALAPLSPPRYGVGIKPKLDAAYRSHDWQQWKALRHVYEFDFVLVDRPLDSDIEPVHVEGPWRLYDLNAMQQAR